MEDHSIIELLKNVGVKFTPAFSFYLLVILAGVTFGLKHYKQLNRSGRLLTQMLCGVFLSEFSTRILEYLFSNTSPAYHFLVPFIIFYIMLIYLSYLPHKKSIRYLVILLGSLSALLVIFTSVVVDSLVNFFSVGIMTLSLFVILNALILFRVMLKYPLEVHILKQPVFWFNSANLFFYGITFFLFASNRLLQENGMEFIFNDYSDHIIYFANIILYSSYFYNLLLTYKQKSLNGIDE